jgi:hypothetical protein
VQSSKGVEMQDRKLKGYQAFLLCVGVTFVFLVGMAILHGNDTTESKETAVTTPVNNDIDVEVLGLKVPGYPNPAPVNGPDARDKICRKLVKTRDLLKFYDSTCEKDSAALSKLATTITNIGPYTNVQNDPDGGAMDLQHPGSQEIERDRLKRVLEGEVNVWNAKYRTAAEKNNLAGVAQ